MKKSWTPEEDKILIDARKAGVAYKDIRVEGRSTAAVTGRISELVNLTLIKKTQNNFKRWDTSEESRLLELRKQGKTFAEIAVELDRSLEAIKTRSKRLGARGLKNNAAGNSSWTNDELELLRNNLHKSYKKLSVLLGRSEKSISSKVQKLGWSKSSILSGMGTLDLERPAILYLADFGEYKKVGVTQDLEERFEHSRYIILDQVEYDDPRDALDCEREILENMWEFRVIGAIHRGSTECFKHNGTVLEQLI
jgi:hypothetical protein